MDKRSPHFHTIPKRSLCEVKKKDACVGTTSVRLFVTATSNWTDLSIFMGFSKEFFTERWLNASVLKIGSVTKSIFVRTQIIYTYNCYTFGPIWVKFRRAIFA
jgi:hypothetical protein